jgi:UDP-N-acetylmuramoylalanine--D-glutamate ligase|tara:strand:- start:404 stop:1768 length:1365 start_codon:yes stop_codon:yes gene_type:complete
MSKFSVSGLNVVVMGAARSGVAAATLLVNRGANVTLSDQLPILENADKLRANGIELELGGHRTETLQVADLIVLSPGVSPHQAVVKKARRRDIPIISEIELAARWLRGRIVAVTGTKGKSTTTVLTGRMFSEGGRNAVIGGNIGTALSSQVEQSRPDDIHVVEVSSFQLELIDTFRPWIAVCLNISPDHLDRHESFDAYVQAKARIFSNQTEDDAMVINADDPRVLEMARRGRARRCWFSSKSALNDGVGVLDNAITRRSTAGVQRLVPLSAVQVPGRHLLSDIVAATAVGAIAGVDAESMTRVVGRFTGLEHALEFVGEVNGVRYVNDSKATNLVAAREAIECFGSGVVVILGGRFKGGSFEELCPGLVDRNAFVIAIGEATNEIRKSLTPAIDVRDATTLMEAVEIAATLARKGGTVLLAPACASLDMFQNYVERGKEFKRAVAVLAERSQS